ncbi:CENP-Q, a CENPA-CAD centromere complex subunit-domain-containing protein [Nemania abortiva]|nr:CENP-Q, a CENPA-CAD centromere complex subunit-domain-containing protein [Nemania abortiva]
MDPPQAANQKRKRGRPTNASRDEDDEAKGASNSTTTVVSQNNQPGVNDSIDDGAMDEGSRPRKRGRRAKDDVPQEEPEPESSETRPSRRRQRLAQTTQKEESYVAQADGSAPSGEQNMSKRGRLRGGQQAKPPAPEAEEEADDENENEGDSSLLRRSKRQRRSLNDSPSASKDRSVQVEETTTSKSQRAAKRRKRPIRSADNREPEEEAEPEAEDDTTSRMQKRKNKRRRSSQDTQPPPDEAEAEPVLSQKKRGRPTKPEGGHRNSDAGLQSEPSQRRKRTSNDQQQAGGKRAQPSTARRQSKGSRRSLEGQDQSPARSSSPDSDSSPLPYRHIAKRTRRVTREVIESKWSSLDPLSIANIATVLHSASLPTLLHVVPKQHAHAEDVLEKVIRGLRKRSARLPFPPASSLPRREDELNFEQTQSAVEVLLSQLDPLQHSVELLRREKERAEKELEREYKTLDRLSSNARAEARERRDRLRKVHVLVPEATGSSVTNSIDLLPADKATGQVFASVRDEELLNLAGQINNHMESMRGNLRQVDGVLPAIAKSHALLRTMLQPQFGQKQLENIILGQVVP